MIMLCKLLKIKNIKFQQKVDSVILYITFLLSK